MINIQNILSVSKYERKTLYRSWFFRIFSIIALVFLFSINMGFFGFHGGIRWTTRAIAANLPYINVLFINVAQAIIAVFLASDFLRRDKKLDTTEVIYTRPVSNGEYVVGKTIGILTLFIGLVILALLMALVFNLIRQDVPVVWQAYLYYPLLITIPTLVFILGLSFLLMIIIRNQAVTFLILLGYIGLTLFYFQDKLHGLLDYMAFNLPMVYSDFIGFGEPYRIILHRIAYFSMGLGFIFATIRYLNRLPQVGRWNAINLIAFAAFFIFGAAAGYRYFSIYQTEDRERIEYMALNNINARIPSVDIVSNTLNVEQSGRKLKISSELFIRNQNRQQLDTLIFSLNPGFKIDSITSVDGNVDFARNRQIIRIIPENGMAPGRRSRYTIFYSGIPVESIAYLDIPDENLRELKRIQVAPIDKKSGIITSNFLLLTPELLWYPMAGVGFNNLTFLPRELDFVRFELTVKPNGNLMAVAPGDVEISGDEFHFTPETDLNALSLVVGPFEKRSQNYGDIDYNLYLMPGHDYFSGFFTNITDTIGDLIKQEKDDWEIDELDLYYPFKRINLVEVPIQFHAYDRPLIQIVETIQPEMILLSEKGAGLNSMDFARYQFYEERRNRRENETRTPKEIEARTFSRFLESTFFRSETTTRPVTDNRQMGGEDLLVYRGTSYSKNPFCVFPLYYSYMTGISSSDFPLFNSMLEIYLKEGFEVSMRQSFRGGMTDSETANMALRDNSLTEIIAEWDNTITSSLVFQSGSFIFLALKNRVGPGNFDNFLYYYLEDHAFREIPFEMFSADFYREFGVEIEPYYETINTKGKIPAFIMSNPEYIQTRDEIGEVYLIRFSLRNTGEAKGMVDVSLRIAGSFGGGGNEEKRLYEMDPGVTKDIQIVLFEQPRMMTVNTLVSGNIPSTFSAFLRSAESVRATNTEEYERISDRDLTLQLPGEFLVDNEDPGFHYVSVSNESKLKRYIDSRKTQSSEIFYEQINPYWTPVRWTPYAHSSFYGESVRSALATRSGEGDNVANWTTVLPAAGFYDVYVYIPMSAMFGRPEGRRRDGDQGGNQQGGPGSGGGRGMGPSFADAGTVYNYTISSNEGVEEIEFPLRNIEDGWNKVGAFHFPADTAKIELSNKTNGKRVFADAVKWVRR
ncbi:MAG: ABC transporter permease subunit [Bacteroidales bacterium]|nr:ABC transporter permease subunit [Bacteroidales bacterium]